MLYVSHATKYIHYYKLQQSENPQKQYQAFQVRKDHIRQIARQNMLYSRVYTSEGERAKSGAHQKFENGTQAIY